MRFDISLIQALVFFIPGAVVLGGLCLVCPGIKDSISTLLDPNPTTAGFIHVAGICFVLGVLTDALRLITIQRLVSCICQKSLQKILKQFSIWIRKDEVDLPKNRKPFFLHPHHIVMWIAKKFAEKEIKPSQPPEDYVEKITSDNLPVFTMLIESAQLYYRLHANLALAFLVPLGFQSLALLDAPFVRCDKFNRFAVILLVAAVLALVTSVKLRQHTDDVFSQFVSAANTNKPKNQGGES